ILLSYVLIINKSVSVLRYLIMFIINRVNKLFNLNIKRLDLMLIIFIIISLINPYYVIDISFILSYLIIFFIVVLNKKKNKLYISFLCFLVSFPLVISINYNINIISFIFNFILKIYNIFIILPISIISLFIPSIDNILYKLINLIETISLFLSNINILNISFSKPSIIFIIIYYILLILYMYDKKYIITILMIILIHKYFYLIDNTLSVTYLDVGQGDSIVITYKSNVILMDTGGNIYSDISNNKTIPYLKSLGKNKIDYLILSHGDYDHMGESINLVNNFKVDNVIFNKDNYNELEQELINVLENNNIKYYNSVNYIDINNIRLYFLNDKIYDNENDNSNIIYFSYYNYNFLFTGDISSNVEKYLVNNYNLNKIDFLKVSHHGSDTSSSKYFIDKLNVVNSIISVGRNNIYNHPSILTLNNLEDTNIYRTDIEGSIKVDLNKNRYKIKTYSP
ncbi:MAG: ComEC/Rec2 family competence protein, partial [Bacilli bacterium]|nr:ComEC/Rec2 family competence protein [Bacilli bacterium]